jgi:hypothetical protein
MTASLDITTTRQKMKRKKVVLKWNKKEKEFNSRYPEWNGGGARAVSNAFLGMITSFEKEMASDWEGKPTGFTNFRDYLSGAGFDPDTFTILVFEKKNHD